MENTLKLVQKLIEHCEEQSKSIKRKSYNDLFPEEIANDFDYLKEGLKIIKHNINIKKRK